MSQRGATSREMNSSCLYASKIVVYGSNAKRYLVSLGNAKAKSRDVMNIEAREFVLQATKHFDVPAVLSGLTAGVWWSEVPQFMRPTLISGLDPMSKIVDLNELQQCLESIRLVVATFCLHRNEQNLRAFIERSVRVCPLSDL